jgi:transcriptional regulator with XRE-family HTH domain
MTTVSGRIKYIRESQKKSQRAFARDHDCSSSFISLIESGDKKPSWELLQSLNSKSGVNINWVISGEGDPFIGHEVEKEKKDNPVTLRTLVPGLPDDPVIDDLIDSLQVPIMAHTLSAQYLLYEKEYRSFIEDFFERKINDQKKTIQNY